MSRGCLSMWRQTGLAVAVLSLAACASQPRILADLPEAQISIERDAPILGARDKAMDAYWEFMSRAPEPSQKVEAMRRLADLELERSEERLQKQIEVLEQSEKLEEVDPESLKSRSYSSAIKLYEDGLKMSSGGTQDIPMLYQLSKAYEQAGQEEKALDALNRLLAIAPTAKNRDELQFRRGEMLFELGRYRFAEQAYDHVVRIGPLSSFYEKALSKRGWAAFKQEHYEDALNSFFMLADIKLKGADGKIGTDDSQLSRGDKELVNDLFRVVTLSFEELGGHKVIKDYFSRHGNRAYEIRVYEDLGNFYLKNGRVRDAAETFQAFARLYPMHDKAFVFDLKAIDAYTSAGFASLLMGEKKAFVQRYRIKGPYWRRHEDKEYTLLAELRKPLRQNSEDVARHLHAQAQKTKAAVDYQTAFLWYRTHLKWFDKSDTAKELNFLYSELLYEAGQYEAAATEYEKTAYQYVRQGKDAEAGYAALLAYGEEEKRAEPKEKSKWRRLMVGSAMRFGRTFPDDPRAAGVVTKAAQEMFALKKYEQAATAARQILELSNKATPEMRRTAWKIIARAEFEKGDYTRAETAYKVALSLTKPGEADYKTLKEGLAAAVYKQGEFMRAKGNTQAAIAQFSRVGEVAPESSITKAAEFDIAVSLMGTQQWAEAIDQFIRFREKNPGHPLAERVSENLIKAYLETKQHIRAAEEMATLSNFKQDPELKRDILWQMAELYEKAGNNTQIITIYKRYIEQYPRPLEAAMEARQKLLELYTKVGRESDRRYWLQEIVKADSAAQKDGTERTRYLAAKAAFELAQPVLQAFQQVQLIKPLKENLKEKKRRMQAAADAYTKAADYGIAEVTTASVYWLAEIYREFGQALMKSERPEGLSGEELEQYDILLEEQAYPFEEKAMGIHESNLGRINDGLYDQWVEKSLQRLKSLNPVRYAKAEKAEAFASRIH